MLRPSFPFLLLLFTSLSSCSQPYINGTLTDTHWSPDSTMKVEVYKQKNTLAMPGQGGDHGAVIVLRRQNGDVVELIDGDHPLSVLHREVHRISWDMEKNMMHFGPARMVEWMDPKNPNIERMRLLVSYHLKDSAWQFFREPGSTGYHSYAIGEFMGDSEHDYTLDAAVLIKDRDGVVRLLILEAYNWALYNPIHEVHVREEYSDAEIFYAVRAGEQLWHSWVEEKDADGLRDHNDVPTAQITTLEHDALYMHAAASSGGGYIFWKDDAWHWLQQD